MGTPWTRDGRVRVYVVTIAPQIAGTITELPVKDDQLVHKGDLLMLIDPTNFTTPCRSRPLTRPKHWRQRASRAAAARRLGLRGGTAEFASRAMEPRPHQQAVNLAQAQVNLKRTRIESPVNGYVTNLQAQLGD